MRLPACLPQRCALTSMLAAKFALAARVQVTKQQRPTPPHLPAAGRGEEGCRDGPAFGVAVAAAAGGPGAGRELVLGHPDHLGAGHLLQSAVVRRGAGGGGCV